jgi:hypothetical protein
VLDVVGDVDGGLHRAAAQLAHLGPGVGAGGERESERCHVLPPHELDADWVNVDWSEFDAASAEAVVWTSIFTEPLSGR